LKGDGTLRPGYEWTGTGQGGNINMANHDQAKVRTGALKEKTGYRRGHSAGRFTSAMRWNGGAPEGAADTCNQISKQKS